MLVASVVLHWQGKCWLHRNIIALAAHGAPHHAIAWRMQRGSSMDAEQSDIRPQRQYIVTKDTMLNATGP